MPVLTRSAVAAIATRKGLSVDAALGEIEEEVRNAVSAWNRFTWKRDMVLVYFALACGFGGHPGLFYRAAVLSEGLSTRKAVAQYRRLADRLEGDPDLEGIVATFRRFIHDPPKPNSNPCYLYGALQALNAHPDVVESLYTQIHSFASYGSSVWDPTVRDICRQLVKGFRWLRACGL